MLPKFAKFIKALLLFSLPLVAFYVLIYLYAVNYPSVFKKKGDYLNNNSQNVEAVFLGSSHAQYAINPRLIDKKSHNIAYGGQTIKLNKMIFDRYAPKMTSLKYLLIEMDYFSLEHYTGNEEYRQPLYNTFYGIAPGNDSFYSKYIFSFDDLKFFTQSAALELSNYFKNKDYSVNEWGFIEGNVNYTFSKLNYDKDMIEQTATQRIVGSDIRTSIKSYNINTALVDSILVYCNENKIKPILITYPVYETYISRKIESKKQRHAEYINKIMTQYPDVEHWDFEQNAQFDVKDFWDDSHLDVSGADKLSAMVNEKLNELD